METQRIHEIALAQGIVPQALAQVTAQVQAHFAGSTPAPVAIEQFLAELPVWTRLGMDQGTFLAMPSTWRMDQARGFAPPPQSRRPVTRTLTPAELDALDAEHLPRHERIEKARVMQQTPAP